MSNVNNNRYDSASAYARANQGEADPGKWKQTKKRDRLSRSVRDVLSPREPHPGAGSAPKRPFAGELKSISPTSDCSAQCKSGSKPDRGTSEVSVELDSGLKVTIDGSGARFERLNTGGKPGGITAAWYSKPVGEIVFDELQPGSIGPGLGGFAERIGNPGEGHVDHETQYAAVALYEALTAADTSELSAAQQANVDKVIEQLKPFIAIPARSEQAQGQYPLYNIHRGEKGAIELDYRGSLGSPEVSVKGDSMDISFYTTLTSREPASPYDMLQPVARVEETLDLSNVAGLSGKQLLLAAEVKASLQDVDTAALTPSELEARDELLQKLEDLPPAKAVEARLKGRGTVIGHSIPVAYSEHRGQRD